MFQLTLIVLTDLRKQMCQTFIPLLSENSRIVNLSSVSSTLKPYGEQIRQRFRNADMTLEDLEQLAREYEVPRCSSHSNTSEKPLTNSNSIP